MGRSWRFGKDGLSKYHKMLLLHLPQYVSIWWWCCYLSIVLIMLLFQPRVFVDEVVSASWWCWWCCISLVFLMMLLYHPPIFDDVVSTQCCWCFCYSLMLINVDADDDDDATLAPCYERWCYWWWEKLPMIYRYANQCSRCCWCCCPLSLSLDDVVL